MNEAERSRYTIARLKRFGTIATKLLLLCPFDPLFQPPRWQAVALSPVV